MRTLLRCGLVLILAALAAACVQTVDGPGQLRTIVAIGYAQYGPQDLAGSGPSSPADGKGWVRCPHVKGTTIGLSVRTYQMATYDAANDRCVPSK